MIKLTCSVKRSYINGEKTTGGERKQLPLCPTSCSWHRAMTSYAVTSRSFFTCESIYLAACSRVQEFQPFNPRKHLIPQRFTHAFSRRTSCSTLTAAAGVLGGEGLSWNKLRKICSLEIFLITWKSRKKQTQFNSLPHRGHPASRTLFIRFC